MALVLQRSNPDHHDPIRREHFWSVLHQGLLIGSIIGSHWPSDEPLRWGWSLIIHAPGMRNTSGQEPTREAAMRAFRRAFDKEIHRIGQEGWQAHVQHMRLIATTSGTKRY